MPALAVGLIGWLFVTGFVVNDGGALRLTGVADSAAWSHCWVWPRRARWPVAIPTRSWRQGHGADGTGDVTLPPPARAGRVDATVGKR